ncbi:alpha/beta fold hydrolase [Rhodoblastus sp.]|uniref:alpha/beta fold hydrolase n=1 Tax=Rhodoblastus sp. TaxID=1962975 RepID=UPI003F9AD628
MSPKPATGRKVVAYDRLGFGESDPFPGKLGLRFIREEACGDFRALHSSLGLGDFIVLGHSVGGGMAIAIAATWPHASFCMEQTTSMAVVVKPSASHRSPRAARRSPTRKYPGMAADSGEQLEFP